MILTYSGRSRPSALKIAEASGGRITAVRRSEGEVNFGRARANTALNPDTSNSTNKRIMRELFRDNDVPMPELYTHRLTDFRNRINFDDLRFPCVGRPDFHMKGRGYWLCRNANDVPRALRGTRRKKAAAHFMEFVEADREYRVHIFKGKSIRISEKRFKDDTKKDYTTAKPGNISLRRVRRAAKAAVEALGLDYGTVDVLATGDNNERVYVLEVNAAPGLGGSMPKLYADTFLRWYDES